MDWYLWLSRTNLDPSLVYKYSLVFTQNELQKEDIVYFDHEFLSSMGISIAKHRLEILNLAAKDKRQKNSSSYPVSKVLFAITRCLKTLRFGCRKASQDDRALMMAPPRQMMIRSRSTRWATSVMRTNGKMVVFRKPRRQQKKEDRIVMLADESSAATGADRVERQHLPRLVESSTVRVDGNPTSKKKKVDDDGDCDGNWTPAVEEIRWDAMFRDLNPT